MEDKYHIVQQRKEERLKQAEELLEEALLQLEYLDKKFKPTGTTANIASRIDTFLQSYIAPICNQATCTEGCVPVYENMTPGKLIRKLFGTHKPLKVIGFKDYCQKHCDWFYGGLE